MCKERATKCNKHWDGKNHDGGENGSRGSKKLKRCNELSNPQPKLYLSFPSSCKAMSCVRKKIFVVVMDVQACITAQVCYK